MDGADRIEAEMDGVSHDIPRDFRCVLETWLQSVYS